MRLIIADKKTFIPINFWEKVYSQVSVQIVSHDMKIKSNTADYKEIMIYVRLITRNNMVSNHVQSNMEDRERNFKNSFGYPKSKTNSLNTSS